MAISHTLLESLTCIQRTKGHPHEVAQRVHNLQNQDFETHGLLHRSVERCKYTVYPLYRCVQLVVV